MRKIGELLPILAAYRSDLKDNPLGKLFEELSTDEIWVCIDYFDAYIKAGTWWIERQESFRKEINRRVVEDRDNKLNRLGI
jgi:NDP-sugar pyrophosphorylase family protein